MPLSPGTRLGHYDVTALLGEGGIGQVWQATDTQLNRQVALKILPDAFAADPDRLARFEREAKLLAPVAGLVWCGYVPWRSTLVETSCRWRSRQS